MHRHEIALFFFNSKTEQLVTVSGEEPGLPVREYCMVLTSMRRARLSANSIVRTIPSTICAAYNKRGRWLAIFSAEGETRRNPGLGLALLLLKFPAMAFLGTVFILAGSIVGARYFATKPIRWRQLDPQTQFSLTVCGLFVAGFFRLIYAFARDRVLIWYGKPALAPVGSPDREKLYKRLAKGRRDLLVPKDISLIATQITWPSAEKHVEWAETLRQNGFQYFGQYLVPEAGSSEEFWFHTEKDLTACMVSVPTRGMWLGALTRYQDGSSFGASNKETAGLDPHPTKKLIYLGPLASAEEVIAQALRDRPNLPRRRPTPDNILSDYKTAWREYVEWRRGRGTTAEEYKRIDERRALRNTQATSKSG